MSLTRNLALRVHADPNTLRCLRDARGFESSHANAAANGSRCSGQRRRVRREHPARPGSAMPCTAVRSGQPQRPLCRRTGRIFRQITHGGVPAGRFATSTRHSFGRSWRRRRRLQLRDAHAQKRKIMLIFWSSAIASERRRRRIPATRRRGTAPLVLVLVTTQSHRERPRPCNAKTTPH